MLLHGYLDNASSGPRSMLWTRGGVLLTVAQQRTQPLAATVHNLPLPSASQLPACHRRETKAHQAVECHHCQLAGGYNAPTDLKVIHATTKPLGALTTSNCFPISPTRKLLRP
jgi:hypothetical protein